MLVRGHILGKLGGFDERYFLSWEDVDLCIGVRKAGFTVAAVPAARIYHKGGLSGRRMPESQHYYAVRNSLLLVRKHEKGWPTCAPLSPYSGSASGGAGASTGISRERSRGLSAPL